MIFVTVGTQLPFARLIDAMDVLASQREEKVIAQTGPLSPAQAQGWSHLELATTLTPNRFEELFTTARLVISHAGIGTILSARHLGKPLVVVPRRHALGEHRNDHQLATALQVENLPGIYVAWQAEDLAGFIDAPELLPANNTESPRYAGLISRLRAEIDG